MTTQPPPSIISGVEYVVAEVDGRPPASADDFTGEVLLRVVYAPPGATVNHEHELRGAGLDSDGTVYFNEKDPRGKDVRRWEIARRSDDGAWVAKQGLY